MAELVAKIAVAAATYWIDKPYEYLIPEAMKKAAVPGARVYVPFSAGNRRSEGIILALADRADYPSLKSITAVLDEKPVLTERQIQLALFMRERFFCTVYDAVKAILPAGLWFTDQGTQRVQDKTVEIASLSISAEEAMAVSDEIRRKSPAQARLLRELAPFGEMPVRELLLFTGTGRQSLNKLVGAEYISLLRRDVLLVPAHVPETHRELPNLNEEQQAAFEGLRALCDSGRAETALLQGVTGSGKTSVYIRLIEYIRRQNRTAILLVPEISLTPQMLETFSSYFEGDVAVLHSSLTPRERYEEWKRLKNGQAHVAIGTRSAVFAPLENLGILIIDDEQESTYRSDKSPRYHAREVARYRCYKDNCLLLLGSATPELSTRYYAETGVYRRFVLNSRYNRLHLPEVSIVDLKKELRRGNDGTISSFLRDELAANIENGEQSILFLNRRGARKLVTCGECGYTYTCPRCSVSLTFHSVSNRLVCHYCGYSQKVGTECPDCHGKLRFVGAGTQLVEEELHTLFPESEVIRMDADALSGGVTHEQIFERFRSENIPIMIGTQMIVKGLNFENVTLVGVLLADQSLYSGDFHASERTFSLITQVIGRSGRGAKAGRAVIQTYTPESEVILQAASQDYEAFYQSELMLRQIQNAPPFADILAVTASGINEEQVVRACRFLRSQLGILLKEKESLQILGPTPLAVVRVNDRYRYRIILRCKADSLVRKAVAAVLALGSTDKQFRGVSFYADSDPEL